MQQLGEQLLDLKDDVLDTLSLDDRLLVAIADARKMKSHEALRRHKQYIGKLMRDVDPEPIRALLAKLYADDRRQKRVFADAERWRDRILSEGLDAVEALEDIVGEAVDGLRDLLKELAQANNDRAEKTIRRNIFRRIHEALAAHKRDG